MAKTLIVASAESTRIPFLRGILTRSLQELGLGFDAAYDVASVIRDELADVDELTSDALRERVADHLDEHYTPELARRYRLAGADVQATVVEGIDGQTRYFSRSQLTHVLQAVGLELEEATNISQRVNTHFAKKRTQAISAARLNELLRRYLRLAAGAEVARRYDTWARFRMSDRPLLILIGGTAGCGKSTIATELATRLNIVRSVSTDMLREVMRFLLPERLVPSIFKSSFVAWQTLPSSPDGNGNGNSQQLLEEGYLAQAQLVKQANEAVIRRALREHVPLILEGVHVYPGMLDDIELGDEVIVVPIMLATLKRKQLRRRIQGRSGDAPRRRADRYLDNFDAIWGLQSFLLSEADRRGDPIISNDEKSVTIQQIMRVIVDRIDEADARRPRENMTVL
ncbi:MAG: AAA family ATPase [Pseudomonadota bacterium]